MKANEIRLVNVKQDQCKVYFHLDNGKTIGILTPGEEDEYQRLLNE